MSNTVQEIDVAKLVAETKRRHQNNELSNLVSGTIMDTSKHFVDNYILAYSSGWAGDGEKPETYDDAILRVTYHGSWLETFYEVIIPSLYNKQHYFNPAMLANLAIILSCITRFDAPEFKNLRSLAICEEFGKGTIAIIDRLEIADGLHFEAEIMTDDIDAPHILLEEPGEPHPKVTNVAQHSSEQDPVARLRHTVADLVRHALAIHEENVSASRCLQQALVALE
jgi:hypothetical protein